MSRNRLFLLLLLALGIPACWLTRGVQPALSEPSGAARSLQAQGPLWNGPDASQPPPTRDRIISFFLIGGSSADAKDRMIGRNIKREGWKGFVQYYILPQIQWGVRRFEIHNPFGTLPDEFMQMDQLLAAREAGLTWTYADFVEAWKPVTSGKLGVPIEVIAYFGASVEGTVFKRLYQEGRTEEWLARAWASVQPALDAGMSIGLDSITGAKADHPAYTFARQLRDKGVRVYVEGLPSRSDTLAHWRDFNFLIMESALRKIDTVFWVAPRAMVQGEILWLVHAPPPGWRDDQFGWELEHYAAILRNGYTLCASMRRIIPHNVTMAQLLAAAGGQAPPQEELNLDAAARPPAATRPAKP